VQVNGGAALFRDHGWVLQRGGEQREEGGEE